MTGRSFALVQMSLLATCLVSAFGCSLAPEGPLPVADYDPASGRLRLISHDTDGDTRYDRFTHMDGTRLIRIEHDTDQDGLVDRWDFFGEDRRVERVGLSTQNDGVMDWQAFYAPDGALTHVALSTDRDGIFDRTEIYRGGVLVRTEEDTDRDGRPDKWDTYRHVADAGAAESRYAITSTAWDESGSGRPERRFVYGPGGAILRIEVHPHIGTDLLQ